MREEEKAAKIFAFMLLGILLIFIGNVVLVEILAKMAK
jgi:hypothetical protein